MKNILYIIGVLFLFNTASAGAYFYNEEYYYESITNFINSPSEQDFININNNRIRNCERVYLEATRRREYTEVEEKICGDIFDVKIQEELDYINYMYMGRGIK